MLIFRYLAREILLTLVVIVAVLLLVLISAQFLHYLQYVADGKITVIVLLKLMGLEVPLLLGYLLPLGFYLSVIIAIGRMCMDNEIIVLSACGISHARLLMMITVLATFVLLITAWLMFSIEPKVQWYRLKLLNWAQVSYSLNKIAPGTFQQIANLEIYASSRDSHHNQLKNIFLAQHLAATPDYPKGAWRIIRAADASQYQDPKTLDLFVVLHQGVQYEGYPTQQNYQIMQFKTYGVRLPTEVASISKKDQIKYMSTPALWRERHHHAQAAELQWRIAMPLSVLILGLLALPISYVNPRQGKFGRLFPAIMIYLIYVNMVFVCRGWIDTGALSTYFGMWWLHILLLCIALIYTAAYVGWKRFFTFGMV